MRTAQGTRLFPISDYAPFEYAVVTAGGVRCDEVNPLHDGIAQSQRVSILPARCSIMDANTGGYNLQIAFSTGRLAGQLKQ